MKKKTFYAFIAVILLAGILLACAIGSSWFTNGNVKTWFNSWGSGSKQEQTEETPFGVIRNTSTFVTSDFDYATAIEKYGENEKVADDITFGNFTITHGFMFGHDGYGDYIDNQGSHITVTVSGDLNNLYFMASANGTRTIQLLNYDAETEVTYVYELGDLAAHEVGHFNGSTVEILDNLPAGTYIIKTSNAVKIYELGVEEMYGVEINDDGGDEFDDGEVPPSDD